MIKKKLFAGIAAASLIFSQLSVFAENAPTENEPVNEPDQVVIPSETETKFVLPKNVRATVITPSVDFLKENGEEGTAAEELDALYAQLSEIGLNTVYIKTVYEDKAYYNTDMNNTGEEDYIALALSRAMENGFRTYMVYDLNYALKNADKSTDKLDHVISDAHRFALKYKCDGILIDNYYGEKTSESYADYMRNGSGIGYDNWLYDSNEMYFSAVSEVIHITDNSIPVGILINDMWANSESKEEGSETKDSVQAFFDGFSDTKKYVEKGYADFCAVNAYGSTTSSTLPFENVTKWWNDLAEANGLILYVVHFNEYQGQNREGWAAVDQLLKQLTLSKDLSAFGGSVFHSCGSLLTDTAVTENITKFYGDQINEDTLFEGLKMQSPSKLSFVTYEPYVDFMGTFDENFEVKFNGMNVTRNSAGYFYFEEPLDIGMNTFTIEHKGTAFQYRIERQVITIKELDSSIAEGKSLTVNGGSRIEIACTAYEGANVTAALNGKTVALKESESKTDEDINSSYRRFVGYYTVPEGIIGQEQNLGTILVSSEYAGYKRSLYGASVKVLALPEPPKPIEPILGDQNSAGSGEVVGTMDPVHSNTENVQYIKVSKDYTNVFNGNTAGFDPTPDFSQLPAGTLDYLLASSGDYYITESGKRFKQTTVSSFSDTGLGENALVVKSTGTSGRYSYFKIKLDYKIGYKIDFVGNNYFSGGDGDFYLNNFTATHVYITFDNITSVTKLPSFEYNYVFSGGKWETVTVDGIPRFRMVLALRQPGVYSGCGATYDDEGDLLLKFKILTNSLQGMTIGIDPGHGYTRPGVFDPGSIGYIREVDANLAIAKEVERQLKALGANVVRLKTESEVAETEERPNILRPYGIDMFISIHSNKMKGVETARGTEAYYFTPYSQPLAAAVSAQIADYFTHNVYSDGADKNRGAKYSYYLVTKQQDFPSILVETAFVSNEEDALALANPEHQKNIAARIVKGIQSYISRSNIGTISSGASPTQTPEQTTPEASEEPPAVTTAESAAETTEPAVTTAEDATETEAVWENTSSYDYSVSPSDGGAVTPDIYEPSAA
ncbi:MAG TPA: N-acetylmuramoyl-L-alanine amidase [Ruminococcaceae bacterium]|nr:N-acetylmuramoyl-L-alanine amidase [Oscillospiraceae bacterium]